jgi:hypothetical protein
LSGVVYLEASAGCTNQLASSAGATCHGDALQCDKKEANS